MENVTIMDGGGLTMKHGQWWEVMAGVGTEDSGSRAVRGAEGTEEGEGWHMQIDSERRWVVCYGYM